MLHSSFFFFLEFSKGVCLGQEECGKRCAADLNPFLPGNFALFSWRFCTFPLQEFWNPPLPSIRWAQDLDPPPTPNNTYSETFAQMYVHSSKHRARSLCQFVFLFFLSENFKLTSLTSHLLWSRGEGTFSRNQRGQNLLTLLPETMHSRSIP